MPEEHASQEEPSPKDAALYSENLIPQVYQELRRLAALKLAGEKPGQTLQATALVHEAYLSLLKDKKTEWDSSRHFFAVAAETMRRILIHRARRKAAQKRGAGVEHEELIESAIAISTPPDELLELDDAMNKLESHHPQAAALVKLRFFVGMKVPEAANALDISPRSAERLWSFAKAWLHREVKH